MKELSIYIHIPFCVRKCLYCDFLSFPVGIRQAGQMYGQRQDCAKRTAVFGDAVQIQKMESYVNLLCREIISEAPGYQEYQVISVFFGGGTPSILPAEELIRILDTVRTHYRLAPDAEITMEMNPGTADAGKLRQYITAGMNRLSIGLQTADDKELARIGRIHDYKTFLTTYELARAAGFENINIDIMAALPGQSISSYERTLHTVTSLVPEHISAYSLILEEGTPLYERRSEYLFPTEEEDREMYCLTKQYLASHGYHRYEISNYAREGYECRHNKIYWQRGDYAGFGLGASSMVRNVRWKNPEDMAVYGAYVEKVAVRQGKRQNVLEKQALTEKEQIEEYMFLGLRMIQGVDCRHFRRTFGQQIEEIYGGPLERLCRQGLLVRENNRVSLTDLGIDVSNYVLSQFLFD